MNEPAAGAVPLDVLIPFYKQGYQIVRNYSSTAYVIFCQRIGNADPLELYQANLGPINTVVDLHYYNLFDIFFVNMSALDNIQYIYKSRESQLQALNGANGPLVFIGKPCLSLSLSVLHLPLLQQFRVFFMGGYLKEVPGIQGYTTLTQPYYSL